MGKIDKSLKLGNRERMIRTCLNQDVDRLPFWQIFGCWGETLERWQNEGFDGVNVDDWKVPLGFDEGFYTLPVNLGLCPAFERIILSEDGEKRTIRDHLGLTFIERKGRSAIPHYIDYPVKTREDWESLKKKRLDPNSPERFPENWQNVLSVIKEKDAAVQIGTFPYGLFGTLRDYMGVENLLTNFCEEPELVHEIMDYLTDFWLTIYKKVLSDIQIDHIHIWEDMSGKHGPLISPAMFREFMKPNYLKIADFAKQNNIPVISVDTDGNMDILMPLLEESGVNLVFPFEVQAGCDIVEYKKQYPNLSILGGIDKRALTKSHEMIDNELDRIDEMFHASGYIPSLDHLIHPQISYENFLYFVKRLKQKIGV